MAEKKKSGRKPSGKYNTAEMAEIINKYTDEAELPILKEVCYLNSWYYVYLTELQEKENELPIEDRLLTLSIKRLLSKKEVELEKGALIGKYQQTMAVFSLKQLGWRDKQDVEVDIKPFEVKIKIVK